MPTNLKFKLVEEREVDKMRLKWTIQHEGQGDSNN